ncbi:MAG: hypothetical protein RL693_1103 [Verrucomicrobiota bacterium]
MKVTISSSLMSLFCGMILLSSTSSTLAQGTAQKFEPGNLPGMMVDEVVVPVPSEIFSVLDKLGDPNWKDELRKLAVPTEADRMELSLIFGAIIAEGFVAVQAQDKQAVEDIGREVIKLSKSLGLSKAVSPHAQSILDAVKNEDWKSVRKELDQTQSTVRAEMDRMHDNDLAQCVSLGGWLRGTASVTSVVGKAYTEDRAELLNQPLLVAYFSKAVNSMSESAKGNTLISAISKGLTKIHQAMESKDGSFTPEKISTIHSTCEDLLSLILQTKKAK